jgi:peptidoglycan/xylan/chitin deacetylase (PgdA/CDA1 family)
MALLGPGRTPAVPGLALTFDDGPDPVWTGPLLDLLASRGARATFFPIADRAAAAPQLIERMLAEGHTVGLHCLEHVRHSQRDAAWLARDTSRALGLLASVGVEPTLWRTPWGDTAAWSADVAAEHGLALVGWSVDTHDWRGDSAEAMFAATRSALAPGAIVLAHDGIGPGARRQTPEETLRYVAAVADLADDRALVLESLELGAVA